eukprot:5881393-Amphidinium_carterae.1
MSKMVSINGPKRTSSTTPDLHEFTKQVGCDEVRWHWYVLGSCPNFFKIWVITPLTLRNGTQNSPQNERAHSGHPTAGALWRL